MTPEDAWGHSRQQSTPQSRTGPGGEWAHLMTKCWKTPKVVDMGEVPPSLFRDGVRTSHWPGDAGTGPISSPPPAGVLGGDRAAQSDIRMPGVGTTATHICVMPPGALMASLGTWPWGPTWSSLSLDASANCSQSHSSPLLPHFHFPPTFPLLCGQPPGGQRGHPPRGDSQQLGDLVSLGLGAGQKWAVQGWGSGTLTACTQPSCPCSGSPGYTGSGGGSRPASEEADGSAPP